MSRPAVLTIAGSDSGGGAGIQADLRTLAAFGCHGTCAIAAITAQNSREVTAVQTLSDSIIEAQIDAVMSDLQPAVIKIGMLGEKRVVDLVARKIEEHQPRFVVLDPVMIASSGAKLLADDAIEAMRERLMPLATIVTPNWDEAAELIEAHPRGAHDIERVAIALVRRGAKAVLLKGGHIPGELVVDTLYDGVDFHAFSHARIVDAEGHGTGCTLASAVAAGLANGQSLRDACEAATSFVHRALEARYAVGRSRPLYLGIESAKPNAS